MKILRSWLQDYFDTPLPDAGALADALTFHTLEVEGIEVYGDDLPAERQDALLDIDVLAHRGHDCLCHRGFAKELATILEYPVKDPLAGAPEALPESDAVSVSIEEHEDCPRYMALSVRGASVGPSPAWLQSRLEALGQRSINNVVDITNYVMLSLGQPLHAFDADALGGLGSAAIRVRRAHADERITVLGGEEYELDAEDLLITDETSGTPLGIAGVKGGVHAEVGEASTDLIIEAANFRAPMIRRTSARLSLRTDASARFEKGLAPELPAYGIAMAAKLLTELAGAEVLGVADAYPRPRTPYVTGVSTDAANRLLGTTLTDDDVATVFTRLGWNYELINPCERVCSVARGLIGARYALGASVSHDAPDVFDCSSFTSYVLAHAGVTVPRISVDQYVSGIVIEESELAPGDLIFSNSGEGKIHHETVEFMPGTSVPEGVDHCGLYLGDGLVVHASKSAGVISEPLAESVAFQGRVGYRRVIDGSKRFVVEVPFERLDIRGEHDLIEEIGRISGYAQIPATAPAGGGASSVPPAFAYAQHVRDVLAANGFSEVYTYTFRENGDIRVVAPHAKDRPYLRVQLTESVEEALTRNMHNLDLLGLDAVRIFEISNVFPNTGEHTALAIGVADARKSAHPMKEVQSALAELFDIDVSPYITEQLDERGQAVIELDFTALCDAAPQRESYEPPQHGKTVTFEPISSYPFALRDIAVWVPESTEARELSELIEREAGDLLVRATLFDEFAKDGRISYAYRLVFQSHEKTLTDEEVSEVMERICDAVAARSWEVR